jgi:hypothetical protein
VRAGLVKERRAAGGGKRSGEQLPACQFSHTADCGMPKPYCRAAEKKSQRA